MTEAERVGRLGGPPTVEVEMCYEPASEARVSGRGWCALRLYTANRTYDIDWSMRCIKVTDRHTDVEVPNHQLLEAVLTGGQLREGERLEISYPLPRPGVAAVFEIPGEKPEYITTSEVKRVVLRMRVVGVTEKTAQPQWTELSSSFRAVGPNGTRPGHGDPVPR